MGSSKSKINPYEKIYQVKSIDPMAFKCSNAGMVTEIGSELEKMGLSYIVGGHFTILFSPLIRKPIDNNETKMTYFECEIHNFVRFLLNFSKIIKIIVKSLKLEINSIIYIKPYIKFT